MKVSEAVVETVELLGGDRSQRNRLAESLFDSGESAVFEFPVVGMSHGTAVELVDHERSELLFVWSVDTDEKSAVVSRGEGGTDAATWPPGTLCKVKPRFPMHRVLQALRSDLSALSAQGLFRVDEVEVPYDFNECAFDVSDLGEYLSVFEVRMVVGAREWETAKFRIDGNWLKLHGDFWPVAPDSNKATLVVRRPFKEFTSLDDDLEGVCGVPATAHDVLCLGAALRLLTGKASFAADVEAQPARSADSGGSAGEVVGQARQLEYSRSVRLREEARRLRAHYPIRMVG